MPTNHDETLLERYTREAETDARMMAKAEIVKVPRELLDKISSLWAVGLDMDNEIKALRAILAQPVADELGEPAPAQAAPQPCACRTPEAAATRQKDEAEAVKLQRILFDRHMDCRPADTGLIGWAAAVLSAPQPEQSGLVEALSQIERWDGFPETGKVWPESGEPMSYGACFGSNGERDFMRLLAAKALATYRAALSAQGGEQ